MRLGRDPQRRGDQVRHDRRDSCSRSTRASSRRTLDRRPAGPRQAESSVTGRREGRPARRRGGPCARAPGLAAAPPRRPARSLVVENGATGEVLLARDARERVPIASITKLMTVLLTSSARSSTTSSWSAPFAAAVGESSVDLRPGERMTVRDLLEAALIQSANDAADALAYYVGRGNETALRGADERAGAEARPARHALRPARRPRRARPRVERPRRHAARADRHAPAARAPDRPRCARRRSRAGARSTPGTTCSATYPGLFGVKTGHTSAAGWSEVAAARGHGRDRLRDDARQPGPRRPQRRPREAARLGLLALPLGTGRRDGQAVYAHAAARVWPRAASPSCARRSLRPSCA